MSMSPALVSYCALAAAIVCEVIGTTFLQQSQQFTRLVPTLLMAVFYGTAFYMLSIALKTIPVGVAYAIWSGVGIVLIAAVAYVAFRQTLDLPAVIGIGLIIAGVAIVNLFSKSIAH